MRWLLDLAILAVLAVLAPIWGLHWARRGKLRTDWAGRFGAAPVLPDRRRDARPRILLHAVSVGEVNTLRGLVAVLARHPAQPRVIVATTTDTGFARATALFGAEHLVVRYPFDFWFAVNRFLDRLAPDVVGLVELEVWPNFTAACARRGIPVGVINGRLTERSHRRYRRVRGMVARSFRRLAFCAVQDETIAARFRDLGVASERVSVTGTMKWDSVPLVERVEGADALAAALGIDRARPLVVAGSTAPDEHALLRAAVDAAGLDAQLLCAPRRPEWFDDAARDLAPAVRRSAGAPGASDARWFVLDTIGELRQAYALADVVVIGRSFGALFGSDMMEPVALGKAVIIGPATSDFAFAADALVAGDGVVRSSRERLAADLRALLADPARREELAANGRAVLRAHHGATARHAALLLGAIGLEAVDADAPGAGDPRSADGNDDDASVRCASPDATMACGRALGATLRGGECITLSGDLGAGKTCFVRGVAAGAGRSADEVSSPTYVIAQEYGGASDDGVTILHVDAYRLHGVDDLESIGWDEWRDDPRVVLVVEWPERIADAIPADAIRVRIDHTDDEAVRNVAITRPGVPTLGG